MSNDYTNEIEALAAGVEELDSTTACVDDTEPITVVGRDIKMPSNEVYAICCDANSQLITFQLPRMVDGVDLSTKIASIKFVNANGDGDRATPHTVGISEDMITLAWKLDGRVTVKDGTVKFQIEFYSIIDDVLYSWQTKMQTFEVLQTLNVDGNIEAPTPTWVQEVTQRLVDINKDLDNLYGDVERINDELKDAATKKELEQLKYYGNKDIEPSYPEDAFGFKLNADGESYGFYLADTDAFIDYRYLNKTVIPYEYNGKPVTTISSGAYELFEVDQVVYIPTSITKIENDAFSLCYVTDVYYGGSKAQWEKIEIGSGNSALTGNSVSIDDPPLANIHFAVVDQETLDNAIGDIKNTFVISTSYNGEIFNDSYFDVTLDKTYDEITEAYNAGKRLLIAFTLNGDETIFVPLMEYYITDAFFKFEIGLEAGGAFDDIIRIFIDESGGHYSYFEGETKLIDKAVQNSQKPITSGGVYDALKDISLPSGLEEEIDNLNKSTFSALNELKLGQTMNTDTGAITTTNKFYLSNLIPVKKGEEIEYALSAGKNYAFIGFYRTEDETSFVPEYREVCLNNSKLKEGTYEVKEDGFIRMQVHVSRINDGVYAYFKNRIPDGVKGYVAESIDAVISPILAKNRDIADVVCASANYQRADTDKLFSLLLASDIHGQEKQMNSIIDYLNGMECIDAGIMTGDIAGNTFASPVSFYTTALANAQKPFLTVIGNHDAGNGTDPSKSYTYISDLCEKIITPNIGYAKLAQGEYSDGDTYYYKDFADYGIRMIVLNQYDYPADISDGTLVYNRGYVLYSQEQIDWLCNTLSTVPENYGVIIALHTTPEKMSLVECDFTSKTRTNKTTIGGTEEHVDGNIITDIVDAWINGTSITETYSVTPTGNSLTELSVNADFSTRGTGEFICYIGGHWHSSLVTKSYTHPNQVMYSVDVANVNANYSDTPRMAGTKSEDCFVVMSVDRTNKKINLVRVGAHMTNDMVDRFKIRLDYAGDTIVEDPIGDIEASLENIIAKYGLGGETA